MKAVASILALHRPQADEDIRKNPFYANHGLRHVQALAHRCHLLLKSNPPEKGSAIRTVPCQVLLFASFLLHDIGMTMTSHEDRRKGTKYQDYGRNQSTRREHDKRSLEFIEQELSPKPLTKQEPGPKPPTEQESSSKTAYELESLLGWSCLEPRVRTHRTTRRTYLLDPWREFS